MLNVLLKIFLLSTIVLLQGCVTKITEAGGQVRIIDNKEKYNCQFITTVSSFNTTGATTGHEADNAMNELRNKASNLHANGVKIIHMSTTIQGTSITAEALRCHY